MESIRSFLQPNHSLLEERNPKEDPVEQFQNS
jgi:hypothetical protein